MPPRTDPRPPAEPPEPTANTADSRPNVLFRLLIPVVFVFVLTCMIMLTQGLFGQNDSGVTRLISRYGDVVIVLEVLLAVAIAVGAMVLDRRETLRTLADQPTGGATDVTEPPLQDTTADHDQRQAAD